MLQRVMPELMGLENIVVLNDEAHHCYRERVKDGDDAEEDLKGEEKQEAKENNEAARMWISGLEIVKRKLGISLVYDLSATPFFLRGSGYIEGTLFPWTMSDFSLMDAIECGIVFVRHAYFLGANDPYKALKTTLKAEIDEEAWASLYSNVSRPFPKPKSGRIAVKVINHLGDEVMKVFGVG
jgi:hypothetical protein